MHVQFHSEEGIIHLSESWDTSSRTSPLIKPADLFIAVNIASSAQFCRRNRSIPLAAIWTSYEQYTNFRKIRDLSD